MMTLYKRETEWKPVVQTEGERLVLKIGEPWEGIFLGVKRIPKINPETGEREDAVLVLLADYEDRRFSMWAGYTLRQAVEHLEPGSPIRIVDNGLVSLSGGRRMRQIEVFTA
jgi:hypothetical protein